VYIFAQSSRKSMSLLYSEIPKACFSIPELNNQAHFVSADQFCASFHIKSSLFKSVVPHSSAHTQALDPHFIRPFCELNILENPFLSSFCEANILEKLFFKPFCEPKFSGAAQNILHYTSSCTSRDRAAPQALLILNKIHTIYLVCV
jgi:hypothetical protein